MLKLTRFGKPEFARYPRVEVLAGDIVPMFAQVKLAPPYEGWLATVIVDGNGIQNMLYNKESGERMIFCRKLTPFPLAVFIAKHFQEPLDLKVLTGFGFKAFKSRPDRGPDCWLPYPFG